VTGKKLAIKGKNLEIISQIVLWYENSFRIDCKALKQNVKLHNYFEYDM